MMRLNILALLSLSQSLVNGNPLLNVDGGLAELEKRTSSFRDLVPTTTINLKTDSTLSTQTVSPARVATATVDIHSDPPGGTTTSPTAFTTATRITPSPDLTRTSSSGTTSSLGTTSPSGTNSSSVTSSTTQHQGTHHHHTTSATSQTAASSSSTSPAAQSTSSQGGAGTTNTVPLVGMLLLGLLGL